MTPCHRHVVADHRLWRARPLEWLTVDQRTLKDNRSLYEHRVLVRLAELLPVGREMCVVAACGGMLLVERTGFISRPIMLMTRWWVILSR